MPDIRIPKSSYHKASGQDVVRLGGKDFYLGEHGGEAAKIKYDQLVAEWLATGRQLPRERTAAMTVTELIAAFWDHANAYYRHPDGTPTKEISSFRDALRPLRRLYGHSVDAEFGPLALKAVRQAMIDAGLCRTNINRRIGRIKRVFKWAVENEMVPSSVLHGLQAVSGLKAGRSGVRESDPVKPVSEDMVTAILPFLSSQVAAMIQLQLLTGMRPGEVVCIRGIDIDTTGKLWLYRPTQHKTQDLGHERIIFFGPRAQRILKPFLKSDLSAYLVSPADADAERREKIRQLRKTPLSCGNVQGSNVKRKPAKKPKDCYSVGSYSPRSNTPVNELFLFRNISNPRGWLTGSGSRGKSGRRVGHRLKRLKSKLGEKPTASIHTRLGIGLRQIYEKLREVWKRPRLFWVTRRSRLRRFTRKKT